MDAKKVVAELKKEYPGRKIILNPKTNPTEILCEVDPTDKHPEFASAISVIDQTVPHWHERAAEIYYVLSGRLELVVDNQRFVLNQDEFRVIPPGKVHASRGRETWVLIYSEPGWKAEDHLLIKEKKLAFAPSITHLRLLVENYDAMFTFYHETLEFPINWGNRSGNYAEFDARGVLVAIYKKELMPKAIQPKLGKHNQAIVVNLKVDDVKTAATFLLQKKVKLLTEPTKYPEAGIEAFYIQDPEGNILEIYRDLG